MSDSLAAPELQSIQCSRDPPPSMSLVVTSPEPQVLPEAVGSTPALLSDLWSQAINEAKGESGILKWLQKYGLMATDGAQQIDQSQTDEKFHVQELISLIEANKLSEQSDKPLKIPLRNQEITARDYIANAVAFITKVGDIAFSCTPMESNAPWTVTKAVLQIPVHRIEQQAALLGTVKWFTSIVRRGQIYEVLYTIETTDKKAIQGLHDGLLQVYIAAIKMLAKSDALFNSGAARQTLTSIIEPNYASDAIKTLFEKEKKLDR
ncbi:uncharacterized protein TrAtP1_000398 [Trichoderma atroviride]|uniref:uncharacterized protein n=1 Tax=Hypocrea atroviridis TaxID=63577 RepID=UPI003330C3AE|nr:hypothetical protein TrAtP1_000398 [Trichoderma atroviride]